MDVEFPKIFSATELPLFDLAGSSLKISILMAGLYSTWLQLTVQTALPVVGNQWWLVNIAAAQGSITNWGQQESNQET